MDRQRNIKYVFGFALLIFMMSVGSGKLVAQQLNIGKVAKIQYGQLWASKTFNQVDFEAKISVNFSEIELAQALQEIALKGDLKLTYRGDIMPHQRVTLHKKSITVTGALNQVLQGFPLGYKISSDRYLIIVPQHIRFKKVAPTVSGVVTDAQTGEPLVGANVFVMGTTTGAVTDSVGHYSVTVPSLQDTLRFSYIGYQTKMVPIQGRTVINVDLKPKVVSGKKMVVVGYGKQKEISIVGAQSTIQNTDILKTPSGSFSTTLAGRLPGVVGVQRTGLPGASNADIWIRGISTFGSANSAGPLILVDGIERPMNTLNPSDIASVTILKDAVSTAVYGARGANGVILIKTKRGHKSSPTFSINYNQGITMLTQIPNVVDGVTYMRLANEASMSRGGGRIYSKETIMKTKNNVNPLLYPSVNWVDALFNNYGQKRQLNIVTSGGSDIAQYRVSLTWYNERGLLPSVDSMSYNTNVLYNKYTLSSNITVDVTPTTTANLGVGGYLTDKKYPAVSVQSAYRQALYINPVIYPIMYPGGRVPGRNSNGDLRNPYADITTRGYSDEFTSQLFTNIDVNQDLSMITPGLSLHALVGFDTRNSNTVERSRRENTYIINAFAPYDPDGSYDYNLTFQGRPALDYTNDNSGSRQFYLGVDINYGRYFGQHHVKALLHYHQSDFQDSFAGDLVTSIPHRERAIAARVSYSYDNRYFVQFNAGYTGSENFAPSNRYGFFPSIGVGWVLSNEEFWESSFLGNIFQFFKVRYSDGFVGASGNPGRRFAYLTKFDGSAAGYTYGIDNNHPRAGILVRAYGVPVQWSKARKQNLGLEIRTLNNHLSLTINFFKEDRKNIFLRNRAMPNFVGLTSDPLGNFGEVINRGIDGKITYSNSFSNDFSLSLRGIFTYNKNKIIEDSHPPQKYEWMNHEGNNVLAGYGYVAMGYFESKEEIRNHADQFGRVLPGDIKYKDLNGDGEINGFDVKKIGRGDVPFLTLGMGVTLRYKSFDISTFFQGQIGADHHLAGYGIQPFYGDGGEGNVFAIAKDHWTLEDPDPNAAYPRLGYGASANVNNYKRSSFWVRRVNFVRMRLLTIGYTLPLKGSLGDNIKTLRFYFRGRNLITFSNFKLWDPELNTTNGSSYPNTKALSLGFQIKF